MSAGTTPSDDVAKGTRLSLSRAQSYLVTALNRWYGRLTTEGHTYVADGHEAIHVVDELLRELYRVRSALIGEIRADDDGGTARVDRLLAEIRAEREAASSAPGDQRPEVGA